MKIICAHLLKIVDNKISVIKCEFNLDFINFFARFSTKELLNLFVLEMAKDCYLTTENTNSDNKMNSFIHLDTNSYLSMMKNNNSILCIICDLEYPRRIIAKLLLDNIGNVNSCNANSSKQINLKHLVFDCNNPSKFDQLILIQQKIDQTMEIMQESIEITKERQLQLETIVQNSDDLSKITKEFYDQSKKLNRCCVIL